MDNQQGITEEGSANGAVSSGYESSNDGRPLSERLADELTQILGTYTATPFVQAAMAGELTPQQYAAWLARQQRLQERLDLHIVEHRSDVGLLSSTVNDFRLHAPHVRTDLDALGGASPSGPEPDLSFLTAASESEPLKLFGHHFVREGLHNLHRYLAGKLVTAWKAQGSDIDRLWFLDPHGAGQRPLWARFCRDTDKHRVTEHERQALCAAGKNFLAVVVQISSPDDLVAKAGEPKRIPVSL